MSKVSGDSGPVRGQSDGQNARRDGRQDMPADLLTLDKQLCFALHAASRCMTGVYQPLLDSLDITYPQYLVLLVLWEEDGARVSRIGERLLLDSATLTPMLKRLEARGLLERRRSRIDERVVEIFLTPEGRKIKRKAQELPMKALQSSRMSIEQIDRLRANLQALTRTLRDLQSAD